MPQVWQPDSAPILLISSRSDLLKFRSGPLAGTDSLAKGPGFNVSVFPALFATLNQRESFPNLLIVERLEYSPLGHLSLQTLQFPFQFA